MKLRNKKTGEIKEAADVIIENMNKNGSTLSAISIDEIKDEWEDYEDERQYTISDDGEVIPYAPDYIDEEIDKGRKSIGNCFKSEEEAEKAVEKIKAWKRLKDAGFEFKGWKVFDHDSPRIYFNVYRKNTDDIVPFLDLLFGGEE